MREIPRRRVLRASVAGVVAGVLAGCTGNGDDGNGDGNGSGNGDEDRLANFLSDARGYDGQLEDHTGADEVTVSNGAGSDGLSFDPAGIRIDAGTTVVWEWTGQGGQHNVASTGETDFSFKSDRTADAGHTFEETFDEAGVALYVCEPHRGQRMKGGIEVVD